MGGDPYTAPAVLIIPGIGEQWELYYICRDYLGSITHITNAGGSLEQELSYDAWGRLRNPATQIAYAPDTEPPLFLGRGYTGHEHLPWFGLINMNARLYDPAVGRFLSPDPYVQAPDFTQNFNRYSYCLNNPLCYVDQDGEFWHLIIGAVIGGVFNLTMKAIQGKIHTFGDGLAAFGIGALAGGVGAATGGGAFLAAGGGAAGAGGFLAGAAGGLFGTAFSSPIQSIGNSMYFGDPMMTGKDYLMGIGIGVLTGGAFNGISALTNGRSFWNGELIPKDIKVTMPVVDVKSIVGNPDPIKNTLTDVSPAEANIREMADKLKPGLIQPKTSQEFNSIIQENNLRLTFRVETHSGLDKIFEGANSTDLIRHANIKIEQYIDGRWIPIQIKGTQSVNHHIWLELERSLKINGLK